MFSVASFAEVRIGYREWARRNGQKYGDWLKDKGWRREDVEDE
jgi:hypothetical protein